LSRFLRHLKEERDDTGESFKWQAILPTSSYEPEVGIINSKYGAAVCVSAADHVRVRVDSSNVVPLVIEIAGNTVTGSTHYGLLNLQYITDEYRFQYPD